MTGVAGDKDALGYFGFAYFEENQRQDQGRRDRQRWRLRRPRRRTTINDGNVQAAQPTAVHLPVGQARSSDPSSTAFVQYYLDNVNTFVDEVGYIEAPADVLQKSQDALAAAPQ